ncbi:ATP-binding response regulator [Sediminibacterium soli]|uniref:ATP-binding response regulator n=1 Tax=Sediminibacterium soli TaxID=2698829 RepID=UPI001379F17F|nr:ATP-binding protein [Sediminibacterium soli]NCI46683.1 response regulator [Sediminibacterium soli]
MSIEIVIFFYLAIFRLARPDDKTTTLNLILIFLLLIYNITGGLLPDPKLPGSFFLQEVIAYATGFITPCYFPYYVYRAFGLTKLKFHVYKGVYLFLILPYCIFVFVFWLTGDLKDTQNLLIIPVLYAVWVIVSLGKAIRHKYNYDFSSSEARQEMVVLLFSLTPWVGLPITTYFDLGQAVEALITNIGFLLLFGLQVMRHVRVVRFEHEKLMESEQRLRSWNADLKDEVNKRTKELEKINEQRTNNFINLVHETKTPLTLIKNYLDEYITKYGTVEELNVIKGGVDKLTADVINLFDLERFSKGIDTYKHNQVSDFSGILRDSLPLFKHYCVKHKIECSTCLDEDIFVKADPNAIHRIVNNIVENAIKFTDPDGEVLISLTSQEDEIIFSVVDTGIGIPEDLQKKVFEPYYQIGYKNTSLQGMGLGLPIVKKVVEGIGGTIFIESNPAKMRGTKIVITLPRYKPTDKDEPVKEVDSLNKLNYNFNYDELSDSDYDAQKRTILLVEDNIAMINFLSNKLRLTYNVFGARNGSEALKKLFEMSVMPDLILSDVMMDKMDGYAFAKTLSEQDKYNHIPIIFLTAKSTPTDRLKGLRLGAIDFISKPFSFEELSQKIETILDSIVRQQKAILSTSIAALKTGKTQEADNMAQSSLLRFEQNSKLFHLTSRETEIARLIFKGKTYKNVAKELFISEKTVTKHIQNIFAKVDVSNKVELLNKLSK